MKCTFCGTDVVEGFSVCRSCGANYRRDNNKLGFAVAAIIAGIFSLLFVLAGNADPASTPGAVIFGAFCLVGGILTWRVARKKRWWRKNV